MKQRTHALFFGLRWVPPGCLIFDHVLDGFHRITLSVTDQANWTSLNPAGGINPRHDRVVIADHLTLVIGDNPTPGIKRNTGQFGPPIPHRSIDRLKWNFTNFPGSHRTASTIRFRALIAQALHRVFAENFKRFGIEMQMQPT